jgi:hypothetical protein
MANILNQSHFVWWDNHLPSFTGTYTRVNRAEKKREEAFWVLSTFYREDEQLSLMIVLIKKKNYVRV